MRGRGLYSRRLGQPHWFRVHNEAVGWEGRNKPYEYCGKREGGGVSAKKPQSSYSARPSNTGKYLTKAALEANHSLVAFVRSTEKLEALLNELDVKPELRKSHLTVITGDLYTEADVRRAVQRLSELGPGGVIISVAGIPIGSAKNPARGRMNPNMVRWTLDEMRKNGLKRFLYQGGAASSKNDECKPCIKLCMPLLCAQWALEE